MADQLADIATGTHTGSLADAVSLLAEIAELRRRLADAESRLADVPAMHAELKELVEVNDELVRLNDELERRQRDHDQLVATAGRYSVLVESTSWRATRPLRQLAEMVRKLTR